MSVQRHAPAALYRRQTPGTHCIEGWVVPKTGLERCGKSCLHRVFPGGKERPGRDADPSPPSSVAVKKEKSYASTLPMGRTACTEPQCLYRGALYFYSLKGRQ